MTNMIQIASMIHRRLRFWLIIALALGAPACGKGKSDRAPPKSEKLTAAPVQMTQQKVQPPSPVASGQSPETPTPDGSLTAPEPPGPGAAPAAAPATVPFTPRPVKALTQLLILLDGSGSMNDLMEAETKMTIAQSILKDLLTQPTPMESKRHLGLRVFGTLHGTEADQCADSQLLTPIGPIEPNGFSRVVEAVTPQGTAPLAFALEQAVDDFPEPATQGPGAGGVDNVLLLIADGSETCQGDPCAVAERMHAGPKKVILHTIGFDCDQKAQEQLRCIATKGDGQFYLARNPAELRSALDQAANANLPYNLRVKVLAGALPLPTEMTVYRAGTQQVVERGTAPGIKFFQLPPGSYDIAITYVESMAEPKPAKLLKGVEVQTATRAEQIVQFDLGQLTLATIDPEGQPAQAEYELRPMGQTTLLGRLTAGPEPKTIALPPGRYDVTVSGPMAGRIPLTSTATGLEIASGKTREQTFRFETGTLFLRAQAAPDQFVRARYTVTAATKPEQIVAEGEIAPEGTPFTLPTGRYTINVTPADPTFQALGVTTLTEMEITAHETRQQLVTFAAGALLLAGKDITGGGKGTPAKTEFQIRKAGSTEPIATVLSEGPPVSAYVAPGSYDIVALNVGANITPAPSILWTGITVVEGGQSLHEANFQLGELKLLGKNAKGLSVPTEFTLYRAGTDEALGTLRAEATPVSFRLTPGLYDVRAEDTHATGEIKPTVWLRDLTVSGNATAMHEVMFTAGKIKVACRGENNSILPCEFRVFAYGTDRPLFSGTTGETWKEFTIEPGKYYMEAGYHEPHAEQFLKKWINVTIAENQIVEQVIRF